MKRRRYTRRRLGNHTAPLPVRLHLTPQAAAVLRHVVWNACYDLGGPEMGEPVKAEALKIIRALPPAPVSAEWFQP